MLRGRDESFVSIVVGEVNVSLLLDYRVVPAIVDTESDEGNILTSYFTRSDGRILGFEVGCKFC